MDCSYGTSCTGVPSVLRVRISVPIESGQPKPNRGHVLLVPLKRAGGLFSAREEIKGIAEAVWCTITRSFKKEDLQLSCGIKEKEWIEFRTKNF